MQNNANAKTTENPLVTFIFFLLHNFEQEHKHDVQSDTNMSEVQANLKRK